MLLKFGGETGPVFKLLINVSVVLENSEVWNEVLGKEVELGLCGGREEAEGGVFVSNDKGEEAVPSGRRALDDTVFWNWRPGVVMSTLVASVLFKM